MSELEGLGRSSSSFFFRWFLGGLLRRRTWGRRQLPLLPGLSGVLRSLSCTRALFVGWRGVAVPYVFLSNTSFSAVGTMNETHATRRDLEGLACQERSRRAHSCQLQARVCTQKTPCLSGVCAGGWTSGVFDWMPVQGKWAWEPAVGREKSPSIHGRAFTRINSVMLLQLSASEQKRWETTDSLFSNMEKQRRSKGQRDYQDGGGSVRIVPSVPRPSGVVQPPPHSCRCLQNRLPRAGGGGVSPFHRRRPPAEWYDPNLL